jgi:hypothetical protein
MPDASGEIDASHEALMSSEEVLTANRLTERRK